MREHLFDLPVVLIMLGATITLISCVWWYDGHRAHIARTRAAVDNPILDLLTRINTLRPDTEFMSGNVDFRTCEFHVCLVDIKDKRLKYVFLFDHPHGRWLQGAGDEDVTAIRRHLENGGFVDQDFLASRTFSPAIALDLDSWSIAVREATAQMSHECSDGFGISLAS